MIRIAIGFVLSFVIGAGLGKAPTASRRLTEILA